MINVITWLSWQFTYWQDGATRGCFDKGRRARPPKPDNQSDSQCAVPRRTWPLFGNRYALA
jgi:hypothetical protein